MERYAPRPPVGAIAVALAALLTVAGCALIRVPPALGGHTLCRRGSLRVEVGPRLSPRTGERGAIFTAVNFGRRACRVAGYPSVQLRNAAGMLLPFDYAFSARPYLAYHRPSSIELKPGQLAYFVVTKYRCDLAQAGPVGRWVATTARIRLPGQSWSAVPAGRSPAELPYAYCTSPGDQLGDTVGVSPLALRVADLR